MVLADIVGVIFTISIVLGFGYLIGLVIYNNTKPSREGNNYQFSNDLAEELESLSDKLSNLAKAMRHGSKKPK